MQILITSDLKKIYPESIFGSLIVKNRPNRKMHEALEEQKRDIERKIRESHEEVDKGSMIQNYNTYFKMWNKTYPIEYQINTIRSGGKFPQVSVLVDSMFLAELNSRILTSGHDLESIRGDLTFDVSRGGERYLKLNGQEQKLKKNDVVLRDNEGLLASILYGPARRTSISLKTKDALYFAWCPYVIDEKLIIAHLNEILENLSRIFGSVTSESPLILPS
ncbi:MAG: phenylalanine--tRNA ligase beta subunit-related protein [Candidatus Hodarchaeales archaeon]|jgi:DNA/RNA-binding domain of Phe-tRNA-synthetase-like protein